MKTNKQKEREAVKRLAKHGIKASTFEVVFKKEAKKPAFQRAYNAEKERVSIAQSLREARLKRKLTQAMVAKRANMPQSVIARLESGNHSISLETLNKVANAVGKRVKLV